MTSGHQELPHDLASTDIADAARTLFYRCGDPAVEVRRRVALREALRSARSLARALDEFTRCAGAHSHGVHCSANLDGEVAVLAQAFEAWTTAVRTSAAVHQERRAGDRAHRTPVTSEERGGVTMDVLIR